MKYLKTTLMFVTFLLKTLCFEIFIFGHRECDKYFYTVKKANKNNVTFCDLTTNVQGDHFIFSILQMW